VEKWNFNFPQFNGSADVSLGGVAFDPATRRVYFSQYEGDDPKPLIQVFQLQ
jgi:hypothetical protein